MNYTAFLRGINISGKNKIAMAELKVQFEKLGFADVSTYLNSGNVLFSSDNLNTGEIKADIEKKIFDFFGLKIPVYITEVQTLEDILSNAPGWWGTCDKERYDNLIFILTQDSPKDIAELLGKPSEELEMVQIYNDVIFWTFDRSSYRKCNWWKKTASPGIAEKLTIRTAATVKKMCR